MRERLGRTRLDHQELIGFYQEFKREFGYPENYTPLAEGLLRRVIKEDAFTSQTPLTDIALIATVRALIPVIVIDLDQIQGSLLIRHRQPTDTLPAETPAPRQSDRHILIVDDAGTPAVAYPDIPLAAFPTKHTTHALFVCCGVLGVHSDQMDSARSAIRVLLGYNAHYTRVEDHVWSD
jgi:DNA/RNA-binding domain of Phe-tRNA-synthetase-like protein